MVIKQAIYLTVSGVNSRKQVVNDVHVLIHDHMIRNKRAEPTTNYNSKKTFWYKTFLCIIYCTRSSLLYWLIEEYMPIY